MSALADLVREGLVLAALLALPIAVAAAAASFAASAAVSWLGVQDQTTAIVARAIAVVVTLLALATTMSDDVRELAERAWQRVPEIGMGVEEAT